MILSNKAENISPSLTLDITAKANQMIKSGLDVISFGAREPDFNIPENIQKSAISAIKHGKMKYTPVSEILELKKSYI